MTVLEQKFLEMVPNTLRSISKSLESIDKKIAVEQPARYVWVFTADQVADGDAMDVITEVYATEEAARQHMHEFVYADDGELLYAKKRGWEVEINEPDHFRSFEEGYYTDNHTEATIEKKEVKR